MLRTGIEQALRAEYLEDGYLRPAYRDYCFANVNPTVLSVLGADTGTDRALPADVFEGVGFGGDPRETGGIDRAVVVFLDGYGWHHWQRDSAEIPLLSELTERGTVTPLTSIYPSETAAATTTFHAGTTPVEHGLLGWWQYVPAVDGVIQPLPGLTEADEPVEEVYPGLTQSDLFAGESLYDRPETDGIDVHLHQPFEAARAERGADRVSVDDTVEAIATGLRRGLADADGAAYQYSYVPTVDAAAHDAGTESDEYRAQLELVTSNLRRELARVDDAVAERTLFVVIADHGMVDTVPAENVDVGPAAMPDVWEALQRDDEGERIPPVGSPRNLHLHLQSGTVGRVRATFESQLPCRTYTRAEAIDAGLFGDREPSNLFRERCGDLVVVHRDRGLWWDSKERALVGMHGGLTPEEMLVPFAAARLSELDL